MSNRRSDIMNGVLEFPPQIMNILNPLKDKDKEVLINEFWDNIWHNYLREKNCNTLIWMDKFNDSAFFNKMLTHLSKAGWITSTVSGNYAHIDLNESKLQKWVSKEELINVKFWYKFLKYRLKATKSVLQDVVQSNGKYIKTGLVREGFMKAGNNKFRYDTKYLQKYLEPIAQNVMKGLTTSTKDITYQEVISELLNYYSVDGTEYTLGNCYIDSRGRSIFECSKKVFNPISCKDARALLICDGQDLTSSGFNAIYSGISELLGYRGTNYEDKVVQGQYFYIVRTLPCFKQMEITKDYSDLHKLIWLERIYENLDLIAAEVTNKWYIPLEIDAQASLIQLYGILTNCYDYMVRTNLIETVNGFQDAYKVEYVSRNHIKKAITPILYGSGKHPRELWDKHNLDYTQRELNQMDEDINIGLYSVANNFKNHIINNVVPKTHMKVNINGEIFDIECNRFKWEETTQKEYYVYTSGQGHVKRVITTLHLVPDPNQFKRYFATLLLHNLDSQIANLISKNIDWIIPIHDSFTVHPNVICDVRNIYRNYMWNIWQKRRRILKDYFESIGITQEYKEESFDEYQLGTRLTPYGEFSPYCLK